MVSHGTREGVNLDYYNSKDAERMAKIGGVPMPSDDEIRRYGPFKAVVRKVEEKYMKPESLEDCIKRNISKATHVINRDSRSIIETNPAPNYQQLSLF